MNHCILETYSLWERLFNPPHIPTAERAVRSELLRAVVQAVEPCQGSFVPETVGERISVFFPTEAPSTPTVSRPTLHTTLWAEAPGTAFPSTGRLSIRGWQVSGLICQPLPFLRWSRS